jgi:hypothetical protein
VLDGTIAVIRGTALAFRAPSAAVPSDFVIFTEILTTFHTKLRLINIRASAVLNPDSYMERSYHWRSEYYLLRSCSKTSVRIISGHLDIDPCTVIVTNLKEDI